METKDKQEMPFRLQKTARKGSERYLIFRTNHIVVTLSWDDGRSPGHEYVCRWFLNRYKQFLGPSKLRNRVFLGKCSTWNWNFQNWSKTCLGASEPIKRLPAQSTTYALRNRQGEQAFVNENEKKISVKEIFTTWKLPAIYNCKV